MKNHLDRLGSYASSAFFFSVFLNIFFAPSTLCVDLISATTFLSVLLLRDPHCGGVVRGTGPHHHKHIERTRVAYKQDATRRHNHKALSL